MKLSVENRNYCAVVVRAETFIDLPNCDNVKACLILNQHVIVGKDTQPGTVGLFFPVETEIMPLFLGPNNLYRKAEYGNSNPESKGGFFEQSGRVKCMKFRGHRSEGFFIPISSITESASPGVVFKELEVGVEFDTLNDHQICRKYVPRHQRMGGMGGSKKGPKKFRKEDLILDGQFRFHYDTAQLKRNLHKLELDTPISISDKWHGTSVVIGHLATKRIHTWYERLLKKIGVKIQEEEFGIVAASRRVIKSVAGEATEDKNHFYDTDLWSLVGQENANRIPKGFTIYGEIVGYTPAGSFIQKGYAYRCAVGAHRLLVYRVTSTNHDGKVIELSWNQLKEFCQSYGLETVVELWNGTPRQIVDEWTLRLQEKGREPHEDWRVLFTNALDFKYLEKKCDYNPGLPNEGIVIRVDHLEESEAYKLKSFAFLERETKMLDEGAEDMETSEEVESIDGIC